MNLEKRVSLLYKYIIYNTLCKERPCRFPQNNDRVVLFKASTFTLLCANIAYKRLKNHHY